MAYWPKLLNREPSRIDGLRLLSLIRGYDYEHRTTEQQTRQARPILDVMATR